MQETTDQRTPQSESEKITLWEEIVKGWHWVVFVWKTLSRLGGPQEILHSLYTTVVILAKRTITQWQANRPQK